MVKQVKNSKKLSQINQKIVAKGSTLPSVKLKDGTSVQTGTVATMLYNIAQYNNGERGSVEEELQLAIPTLFKVGLFDLFPPKEWIKGTNAGRKFIGKAAIQYQAFRKSK